MIWLLPRRALLPLFVAGIIGAQLWRNASPEMRAYTWTPMRLDGLMGRAALAVILRHPQAHAWCQLSPQLVYALLIMVALTATTVFEHLIALLSIDLHSWFTLVHTTFVAVAVLNAAAHARPVLARAGAVRGRSATGCI